MTEGLDICSDVVSGASIVLGELKGISVELEIVISDVISDIVDDSDGTEELLNDVCSLDSLTKDDE